MLKKGICIFWLLASLTLGADVHDQFYPAKVYSLEDGIPAYSIYDITQSQDGVMWFISSKGVFSYNSLHWKLYPDSLHLPSSPYSVIRGCSDGTVWVAGQNNRDFVIKYFINGEWVDIDIKNQIVSINNNFTFDVKPLHQGYSILITVGEVMYTYYTQSKKIEKLQIAEGGGLYINSIFRHNDLVYISTSKGIMLFDGNEIKPWDLNHHLNESSEVLQVNYSGNMLYILGKGWLARSNGTEIEYLSKNINIEKPSIYNKHSLEIDQLGSIFYCSQSLASYFDVASSSESKLMVNGSSINALSNKIFIDRENNIWVGDYRGLFKFNLLRFRNYNGSAMFPENEVSSIFENEDQVIVANPRYLNIFENGNVTKSIRFGDNFQVRILDIAKDDAGRVFIASSKAGLFKYENDQLTRLNWETSPKETGVMSVEVFNRKVYFSSNQALYEISGNRTEKILDVPGIRNLQTIEVDKLAALSTAQGLLLLDQNNDTTRFQSELRNYNNVFSLVNWKGEYIVATAGGTGILKNKKIEPFEISPEMRHVSTYCFLEDRQNRLWIGSNEGVYIWDGKALINYNKSQGLVGNEVNRNALMEDKSGNIWIGTESGVTVYNQKEDLSLGIKPLLQLGDMTTQKGTTIKQSSLLSYDDNTLEFKFQAVSFFDEEEVNYRYKLDGFDDNWIYADNRGNTVRYTNIPHGAYEFVVQAGIAGTNWSDPAKINFKIAQPFYSELWFIILMSALAISFIYIVYRIRFYVAIKNQERLKKLVRDRTKEIATKNNEIEASNEELKQQSEEITAINERLEDTVQERTKQLKEQNTQLVEYAFINSHKLRAPICRMLGLLYLLEISPEEEKEVILNLMSETGRELDEVSKEIDSKLDSIEVEKLLNE